MELKKVYPGRIIFDHLPKTAGQSVANWLGNTLGTDVVKWNLFIDHNDLISRYGGKYSVLSGHLCFNGEGLDSRYQYVTYFREPIDRVVSWLYFHLYNLKDNIDYFEINKDIKKFIESDGEELGCIPVKGLNGISNVYVNHISSIIYPDSLIERRENFSIDEILRVINEFEIWGLYERLPIFLKDFSSLLQVPAPKNLPWANKTEKRPLAEHISKNLVKTLKELNALDIELYIKLKEIYNKSRLRWKRSSVVVSPWLIKNSRIPIRICSPKFLLLSFEQ